MTSTNITGIEDTTVIITCQATGTPQPTVQWQVKAANSQEFDDIASASNTTTYEFTCQMSDNGNQYRAIADNGITEPSTSDTATLSVIALPSDVVPIAIVVAAGVEVTIAAGASTAVSVSSTQFGILVCLTNTPSRSTIQYVDISHQLTALVCAIAVVDQATSAVDSRCRLWYFTTATAKIVEVVQLVDVAIRKPGPARANSNFRSCTAACTDCGWTGTGSCVQSTTAYQQV
jgi:hypothetical protein